MNNAEIEAILYKSKYTRNIFRGCHPIDHINKCIFKSKKMKILVFNTDTSDGPGQHWILLILRNQGVEIYDSLHLYTPIIRKKIPITKREPYRVQSYTSNVCGAHVILLATLLAIGITPKQVFKHVYRRKDFSYNDNLARQFTRRYTKEIFES